MEVDPIRGFLVTKDLSRQVRYGTRTSGLPVQLYGSTLFYFLVLNPEKSLSEPVDHYTVEVVETEVCRSDADEVHHVF